MPTTYFTTEKLLLLGQLRKLLTEASSQEKTVIQSLVKTLQKPDNINVFRKKAKKFITNNPNAKGQILKAVSILQQARYVAYRTTEQTSDMEVVKSKSKNIVYKGHKSLSQENKGKEKFQKAHNANTPISQIEACASRLYLLLVGRDHAVKIVEVFEINESGEVKSVGTRSDAIPGFMDYSALRKYFSDQNPTWTKEQVAEHVFNLLADAGLGKVYAALRFGQEDDLTTRNLGVSTHTENSELVIDKVVIFDVDRSFGSAIYGESNKYGVETRSLWSSNTEAFAITSDEIDNPSKETGKGMYYGPAQAPTFVADKNKWTEVDRLAFKKISTDPNGRFCQDFNYTLFKAAFIFEPVLASIVRGTVRNEGLLLDIPVCLTSSMQSAQIAISESKNWEQSFLRNYGSWKQQAIDEICASKEYKTAWDMARRSNLGLPENPRDYVIKQFENMFLAITNFNSCLLKIKDSLEDLKTQIKEMPIPNEHKELLLNVLNMASLSADTSEHLTRRELFAHYKYIDTARDLIKNSEKSEESQNSLSLDRFNDNNLTSRLNVISATIAIINDAATKHNSPLSLKICCLCRNIYNLLKRLLKIKSQTKKATYSDISKQLDENLAKGYTASATLTPSPTRLGAPTM